MADRAIRHPKIEVLWDSVVTRVEGTDVVSSVTIQNVKTKEKEKSMIFQITRKRILQ